MLKGFKEFALRGNVIDLAVGVIIGAAFGKIIASLVDDVIMPPVGLLLGKGVDFKDYFFSLNGQHYESLKAAKDAAAPVMSYGVFLNTIINFLIVAFAIYLLVHQVNRWASKPAPAAPPTTRECPQCAMAIPINARRCPHCTSQLAP
jgi:large conductance mechanosensitive channel